MRLLVILIPLALVMSTGVEAANKSKTKLRKPNWRWFNSPKAYEKACIQVELARREKVDRERGQQPEQQPVRSAIHSE